MHTDICNLMISKINHTVKMQYGFHELLCQEDICVLYIPSMFSSKVEGVYWGQKQIYTVADVEELKATRYGYFGTRHSTTQWNAETNELTVRYALNALCYDVDMFMLRPILLSQTSLCSKWQDRVRPRGVIIPNFWKLKESVPHKLGR